jgi:hypothetical protein
LYNNNNGNNRLIQNTFINNIVSIDPILIETTISVSNAELISNNESNANKTNLINGIINQAKITDPDLITVYNTNCMNNKNDTKNHFNTKTNGDNDSIININGNKYREINFI